MKFSFKLSPKTIFIGAVILVVAIYIVYALYKRYYSESYLQFSPGNETAFLMDGVENYKHSGSSQHKYDTQEDQIMGTMHYISEKDRENFTINKDTYGYNEPMGEGAGTISFGRYGSSFIV